MWKSDSGRSVRQSVDQAGSGVFSAAGADADVARSYCERVLIAIRFQLLICTAAKISHGISASVKCGFSASKLSLLAPLSAIRVSSSVQARAARSLSE